MYIILLRWAYLRSWITWQNGYLLSTFDSIQRIQIHWNDNRSMTANIFFFFFSSCILYHFSVIIFSFEFEELENIIKFNWKQNWFCFMAAKKQKLIIFWEFSKQIYCFRLQILWNVNKCMGFALKTFLSINIYNIAILWEKICVQDHKVGCKVS